MTKIDTQVTRTDSYLIEIDPKIWTKKAIADWASVFYPAEHIIDIAGHLAQSISNTSINHEYYEGFGYVKKFHADGSQMRQYKGNVLLTDDDFSDGIRVRVISHDYEYEAEMTIIKDSDLPACNNKKCVQNDNAEYCTGNPNNCNDRIIDNENKEATT